MFTTINIGPPIPARGYAQSNFSVTKRDVLHSTPDNIFHPRTSGNDVRANLPGSARAVSLGSKVFGSSAPARLIKSISQPVCAPVAGAFVLWVSNTEHDPFHHKATGASSCHVCPGHPRSRTYKFAWSCAGWGITYQNPPTFGLTAHHDSCIGAFGRGADVYGPYDGAGGFAAYPRTGAYARGGAVDGPYGETRTVTIDHRW